VLLFFRGGVAVGGFDTNPETVTVVVPLLQCVIQSFIEIKNVINMHAWSAALEDANTNTLISLAEERQVINPQILSILCYRLERYF